MEKAAAHPVTQPMALTQAVWKTLTERQRAAVRQALLQVCQQLVAQGTDEVRHAPASRPR